MSITIQSEISGDVSSASKTNANYTAIANGTSTFAAPDACQTEWCTAEHIDKVHTKALFNSNMNTRASTGTYTCAVNAYELVSLGGYDMQITFAVPVVQVAGSIIRIHADINVDDVFDISIPPVMMASEDCFFLQFYYTDGNAVTLPMGCEWGYSITHYTNEDISNVDTGTGFVDFTADALNNIQYKKKKRFRCSITGFLGPNAAGIASIQLMCRINDLGTIGSIDFTEATLVAFVVRE